MKKQIMPLLLLLLTAFASCNGKHFIGDSACRKQVKQDFALKQSQLPHGDLFNIFRTKITPYEREALMFLYAYMPVGDITDYPGDYHLDNVRLSARIRNEMPWGHDIPDDIFRHFVLPVRVNNENLDDSRRVFFDELKDRVRHLSLHDAVLEVNHWCHEKVVYTPTDGRTASPLASVKMAYGRCGEEATFTVAALRSVGIPARQVYTPRWAHTDDNHAWVEAWVDGRWRFLGACEPEPVLDLGWFNAAASRGLLMISRAFGHYDGPEEVMQRTPLSTDINLIENYAPAAKVVVEVLDTGGKPVADAKVGFNIYNYAGFHPAVVRYTDSSGLARLTAGLGDMLVWASKDGIFGFAKVSFGKDEQLTVVLNSATGGIHALPIDIVPPPEKMNAPEVTPAQREANDARLAHEDSLRNNYAATFMDTERATAFVTEQRLQQAVVPLLVASRGNWSPLTRFLTNAGANHEAGKATALLSVISAKDLRDITAEVLEDHLYGTPQEEVSDTALFNRYVLNPRAGNEMIVPYRKFFREALPAASREAFRSDPRKLVEWCRDSISSLEALNLPNTLISPVGVWKARMADRKSRGIFFVALARSLGIPAWLDNVTGKTQYHFDGRTLDVDFEQLQVAEAATGTLMLRYKPTIPLPDPRYYDHFTLSKLDGGALRQLNYAEADVDMGGGTGWRSRFKQGVKLDAGQYLLVSGTRQRDGSVPAQLTFFDIREGETTNIDLIFRAAGPKGAKPIARLERTPTFQPLDKASGKTSEQCSGGRDGRYVLAIVGPGQEPTNHALRDIAALGRDFEARGLRIILLFRNEAESKKFRAADFPGLPKETVLGIDRDGDVQRQLTEALGLTDHGALPIVIVADASGNVRFKSQGYTIGLGQQLLKETAQE